MNKNEEKLISTLSSLIYDIRTSEFETLKEIFTENVNTIQSKIIKKLHSSLILAIKRLNDKLRRSILFMKDELVQIESLVQEFMGGMNVKNQVALKRNFHKNRVPDRSMSKNNEDMVEEMDEYEFHSALEQILENVWNRTVAEIYAI